MGKYRTSFTIVYTVLDKLEEPSYGMVIIQTTRLSYVAAMSILKKLIRLKYVIAISDKSPGGISTALYCITDKGRKFKDEIREYALDDNS